MLAVVVYPAVSTGPISITVGSMKAENADHVFVTIDDVWAHRVGQVDPQGWDLVVNQSQTVDLTALVGSSVALGKGTLSVAKYDVIRLDVSNVTWVYNKTSTQLQVESSQMPANVQFTIVSGKETVVALVLTGHEETIGGTNFFASQLNATATLHS